MDNLERARLKDQSNSPAFHIKRSQRWDKILSPQAIIDDGQESVKGSTSPSFRMRRPKAIKLIQI